MLDGDVGLEHMTQEAVFDPKLREARLKVKFFPAPDDSPGGILGESFDEPACVVIKTKDGRTFSEERQYAIGSFQEPLTQDQFRQLYHKFTRGVLSEENSLNSAEKIFNLERINSVKELTNIISEGQK